MMQDGDDIEAENDNMSEPLDPNWKSWYAANEKYKLDLVSIYPPPPPPRPVAQGADK